MVKFRIRSNPSGQYYLPKEVREELGRELELFSRARATRVCPEVCSTL